MELTARRTFTGDGWTARVRLFLDPGNPTYRAVMLHELASGTSWWQTVSRQVLDHETARREYDILVEQYDKGSE